MADRVFFVAGSPDDLIRGVTVPQQMISDLLEISKIPHGVIEKIGTPWKGREVFSTTLVCRNWSRTRSQKRRPEMPLSMLCEPRPRPPSHRPWTLLRNGDMPMLATSKSSPTKHLPLSGWRCPNSSVPRQALRVSEEGRAIENLNGQSGEASRDRV